MTYALIWLLLGSLSLNLLWVHYSIGKAKRGALGLSTLTLIFGPLLGIVYFRRIERVLKYLMLGTYKTPKIELAEEMCKLWHKGQVRKYTGEPYSNHPIRVSEIVSEYTHDEDTIISALLHDSIEDTDATFSMVYESFNITVATTVIEVTNPEWDKSTSRAERLKILIKKFSSISKAAKIVKMADILHNITNIARLDPKFAEIYLIEKETLLPFLKEGSVELHDRVLKCIEENRKILAKIKVN